MRPDLTPKDIERFWSKVDRSGGPESCWLWIASCDAKGYGQFFLNGRLDKAHRVAWRLTNGVLSKSTELRKECQGIRCVNPRHWAPRLIIPASIVPCVVCGNPVTKFQCFDGTNYGTYCSRRCAAAHRTSDPIARFWSKVIKSVDPDGCWIWTGSVRPNDYGRIKVAGQWHSTHRYAWELEHGPIPDEFHVLHHCDVRRCVRNDGHPGHLFLGTNQDNMDDRDAKGRQARGDRSGPRLHPERMARGERNGWAKLTDAEAIEIKARYASGGITQTDLASMYGVCQGHISRIILGKCRL